MKPLLILLAFVTTTAVAADTQRVLVPAFATAELNGAGISFATTLTAWSPAPCHFTAGGYSGDIVSNTHPPFLGIVATTAGRMMSLDAACAGDVHWGLTVTTAVYDGRQYVLTRTNLPVVPESLARTGRTQLMNVPVWMRETVDQTVDAYRHRLRVYDFDYRGDAVVDVNYYIPFQSTAPDFPEHTYTVKLDRREGTDDSYPVFGELLLPNMCRGIGKCGLWDGRVEIIPRTPGLRYWAYVSSVDNLTQQITVSGPQ